MERAELYSIRKFAGKEISQKTKGSATLVLDMPTGCETALLAKPDVGCLWLKKDGCMLKKLGDYCAFCPFYIPQWLPRLVIEKAGRLASRAHI